MTEVSITARLEVRQVESGLRSLGRKQKNIRKQLTRIAETRNRKVRAKSRRIRGLGLLAGLRAVNRFRGAKGENVDPWEEALVSEKALVQRSIDQQLGFSARAVRIAAEETRRNLADWRNTTSGSAEGTALHFELIKKPIDLMERGRQILRADPRFSGPTFVELLAMGAAGYVLLLWNAMSDILELESRI